MDTMDIMDIMDGMDKMEAMQRSLGRRGRLESEKVRKGEAASWMVEDLRDGGDL